MSADYDGLLALTLDSYSRYFIENLKESHERSQMVYRWMRKPGPSLHEIGPIHGPEVPPATVADLIAHLWTLPPDTLVFQHWCSYADDYGYDPIDLVELRDLTPDEDGHLNI